MPHYVYEKPILLAITLLASIITFAAEPIAREKITIDELHIEQLHFPKDFLFGFALAEYQNSGAENDPDSQWATFEKTMYSDGTPHIRHNGTSGKANDHWNRYQDDINLMKSDFNANAFRFSLAWSRIEPEPGVFNEEALQHYSDEVDACLKAGITPMITLHHFVHPQWFEEMGAFEKEENIPYFVRYSQRVFKMLGDRVHHWCTINEPTIFIFQGYLPLNCVFPPAKARGVVNKITSWSLANKVLKHLMQAHTEVYRALKDMPAGTEAQIGIVHQYLKFDSYSSYDPLEKALGWTFNYFMVDAVIDFLKTGTFSVGTPGLTSQTYTAPEGKLGDFVGLNYYSQVFVRIEPFSLRGGSVAFPGETMTDMEYGTYPRGIYDALQHMSSIGLPIYITENGVDDKKTVNDTLRQGWIKRYLKAVSTAIEDGVDVRGFFWWTLTDNFEWANGWDSEFGLYTKDRQLKEGSKIYADIVKAARRGDLEEHTDDFIVDKEAFKKAAEELKRPRYTWTLLRSLYALGGIYLVYKLVTSGTGDSSNVGGLEEALTGTK